MTKEQVATVLRHMENVRLASYETDSKAEERRLTKEYGRLFRTIKPYILSEKPYTERDLFNHDQHPEAGAMCAP